LTELDVTDNFELLIKLTIWIIDKKAKLE
jgi:hypothetical protein